MSDTTQVADAPEEVIFSVPVTKAGKTAKVEVHSSKIHDAVYRLALELGLKTIINRGMSKIKSGDKDEAMRIALENVENVYTGKVRGAGVKAKKATGAVMAEARRIAKALVKDAIRAAGKKVSQIKPAVITEYANALIEKDPSIIVRAEKAIEERSAITVAGDLIANIPIDADLVKKTEAAAAKKKQLSAAQAGKTQTRAKPQAQA